MIVFPRGEVRIWSDLTPGALFCVSIGGETQLAVKIQAGRDELHCAVLTGLPPHYVRGIAVQNSLLNGLVPWGVTGPLLLLDCATGQKGEWIAGDCEISDHRNILQLVRTDTIVQQDGVGPWLVKEFQAPAANHHHRMFDMGFRDGYPVRWQSYPNATTADEAYDMAKVRADKELRSYRAKSGAISRKHKRRASKAAVEVASDACHDIRQEIAEAPASGPLATAVKLALWAYGNDTDPRRTAGTILEIDGRLDKLEHAALWSVYTAAVTACGYDPLTAIYEAIDRARREAGA